MNTSPTCCYRRAAAPRGAAAAVRNDSLGLHEDAHGEVHVKGLSEVPVHTIGQALALVRRALRGRAVRQTDMNSRSSRSHAVLQLLLEQAPSASTPGGTKKNSLAVRARLNLVDLAGSERVPAGSEGQPLLSQTHQRDGPHQQVVVGAGELHLGFIAIEPRACAL